MASKFASGKVALAICDRCGFTCKYKELKADIVKAKPTGLMVCPTCFDKDNPQLLLGTVPVNDPQALRNPRPDNGNFRDIQWGWSPIGGAYADNPVPNNLVARAAVGTVTIEIS